MPAWSEHFAQVRGLTIHYYRIGGDSLPAIILLHGVMDNGLGWIPVARNLQEHFDVLMPDARGHGKTGGSLEGFSYQLLAEDVAALIRALGLENVYLFGHSMGAMTAAMVAARSPELVRAVVLEDPPFMDPLTAPTRAEEAAEQIQQFFQSLLALKELPTGQRLVIARQYNPLWDEIELAPWVESKLEFNPDVFRHLERVVPWRDLLPRIRCPILLVTGDPEAHAIITDQVAEEGARLWQQGKEIQIAGAGHCIHRDRYAEPMSQIQSFLSEV
ncbi:MAG TPA: alpha/beta hydrolase [Ktedonobacterales bacterium]|jgi:pimeloyl-ACP methyl ester carboxylesterase